MSDKKQKSPKKNTPSSTGKAPGSGTDSRKTPVTTSEGLKQYENR